MFSWGDEIANLSRDYLYAVDQGSRRLSVEEYAMMVRGFSEWAVSLKRDKPELADNEVEMDILGLVLIEDDDFVVEP